MQRGGDDADGRFDAMVTRLDPAQVRQRDDQADGAVPAHAEIADVVEKDDPGDAGRVFRFEQQRADHHVRTARFIHDGRAKVIERLLKTVAPDGERSAPEVRAAGNDDPRRFTAGVRIHDPDALNLRLTHG